MPLDKEGMNLPYCCLAVLQHVRSPLPSLCV